MKIGYEIDYSALTTYILCRRKFLLRYVLHLTKDTPNIDLFFGTCMHKGIEDGYRMIAETSSYKLDDIIALSCASFNEAWNMDEYYRDVADDIIYPKSPGRAMNIIADYWHGKFHSLGNKVVLSVELPFSLMFNDFNYFGKIDLLLYNKERGVIEVIDHKTAKNVTKATPNAFASSYQLDGYGLAAKSYIEQNQSELVSLPIETVIDVLLVQKGKTGVETFMIMKNEVSLRRFISDLNAVIKDIRTDYTNYKEATEKIASLSAFRCSSGNACVEYFRPCPYYNLCKLQSNPLRLLVSGAPHGFTFNEWMPSDKNEYKLVGRV